ncbi:hypothetical protein DPEC_G00310260 [Dallia pectoralis]|uniref:Uncharacterized protein n=1 Tax=Dallia pectoralis TaxID=75939 RepID=A0ACC2FF52_DALPE|nr:hypothetical protein DPEC_G00310260 [Dallia pectoralis]
MAHTINDKKPKPGDMIEIFRPTYQHWALYIGDDLVIHLAPTSEVPDAGFGSFGSVTTHKAMVKCESIWVVAGKDEWRVNNLQDKTYQVRPIDDILRDAKGYVGTILPYFVFSQNCEHFVTKLRYGKAESRQVLNGIPELAAVGVGGAVAFGVAALIGKEKNNKTEEY